MAFISDKMNGLIHWEQLSHYTDVTYQSPND